MLNGEISLRNPWPLYRKLTLLFLAFTGLGIVMVYNTTFATAGQKYLDPYYFLKKNLIWAALGFIAFLVAQRIQPETLRRYCRPALILSLIILALVLAFGREVNGAKRWIGFGPFTFQPSEFAKIAIVVYLADFLARKRDKITKPLAVFLPPGILIGLGMALILVEPDLGTVMLLAGVIMILYYVAGIHFKYLLFLAATFVLGGGTMIWLSPYRRVRFLAFLDPWRDPLGSSYHIAQSLIGVGSGGLVGVGLGHGRQKLFFLPEAHTDFIFANIAEEWGLFGSTVFLAFFLLAIYYGLQVARRETDRFRSLLALGITSVIGLQMFLHVGVVLSLLPTKGITLPFISYGGSSLIFTLFSAGLLVNLARGLPPEEARL